MDLSLLTQNTEYLAIIGISIFMSISPGPDFFMVSRNSIMYNKEAGVYSALGVCIAIWIHVAYSIAGLAILVSKYVYIFSIIKYLGAAYLIYIGIKTIISKPENQEIIERNKKNSQSKLGSFKIGFITNALNPKATIFFLSIFTQVVTPETTLIVQISYGLIISIVHFIWFYGVAHFFSHPIIMNKFKKYQNKIENIVGIALILFGIKVAFSKTN